MKRKLRSKRLRKIKLMSNKKVILIVALVFFITVGFSALSTTLGINGNVVVKKKIWDATEVSYKTSKNPSVTNSKEAIEDLHAKFGE